MVFDIADGEREDWAGMGSCSKLAYRRYPLREDGSAARDILEAMNGLDQVTDDSRHRAAKSNARDEVQM